MSVTEAREVHEQCRPRMRRFNFDQSPFIVIWETTQACDLACIHCRACAQPDRHPGELTTDEVRNMVDRIRAFGSVDSPAPLFVLTGGDPLKRPDIFGIVEYAADAGLRVALTPSATPLVTPSALARLKSAGVARLAVSLDGSNAAVHDHFRGVSGSFHHTLRILCDARSVNLETQVNTTVSRHNLRDLEGIMRELQKLDIALWSVFFIVPVGRAGPGDLTSPVECETVLNRLYEMSHTVGFDIKTTAAPHYRRVVLQRQGEGRRTGGAKDPTSAVPILSALERARGVNDGNGFMFISHTGEIYPSGFLPITAGNVRHDDLISVYRVSDLFRVLRDPRKLKGKCRLCEFRKVCGGSRARAYALTGDYMEADPSCAYMPSAYIRSIAQ